MNEFDIIAEGINEQNRWNRGDVPSAADYTGEASFIDTFFQALSDLAALVLGSKRLEADGRKETNESINERASEALAEVFDHRTLSEWGSMSMEAREAKLSEYYEKLGEIMGIDAKGIIIEDCFATARPGVLGYNSGDGYLHIDYRNIQNPEMLCELLSTTLHEARHQLQFEAIEDPSRFPWISPAMIEQWEYNMVNYHTGEFGIESYITQIVEVDANVFAADILNGYAGIMGF